MSSRPQHKFSEIAQVVIAAVALLVACMTAWLTIVTRRDDIAYRELSIQPFLVFTYERLSGKMSVKNLGLGPAVIDLVTYEFGKSVLVEADKDAKTKNFDQEKKIDSIQSEITQEIISKNDYYEIDEEIPELVVERYFPVAATRLPPGSVEIMIDIKNMDEIEKYVSQKGKQTQFDNWRRSLWLLKRGKIIITYCSITKKWCSHVDTSR